MREEPLPSSLQSNTTADGIGDSPTMVDNNDPDNDETLFRLEGYTNPGELDDDEEDDEDEERTLRHSANCACKKLHIGTAIMPAPLFQADAEDYPNNEEWKDVVDSLPSTMYARFVAHEFNAVVIEHHLKWGPLCGESTGLIELGKYDFTVADRMVDWALSHNLLVKGHVLVWSVTSPPILQTLPADQVQEHVKRHIFTVMNHFRGRIHLWDVVNEPLAPDGSLARNVFVDKLGVDYIADCFRWAHEADPTAQLFLNENKVEGIGSPKSERFYELVHDLVANRHVPIHGIGLQAHFNAAGTGRNRPPTPYHVKRQIRRLGELGLSVNLSELDVRVSQLAPEVRSVAQTSVYHDLVAAALSEPACDGIWLWGFTDRHTWVTHFYYDDEPCVTDEDYRRKPCYYGLRQALQSLSVGGMVGGGPRLDPVLLDSNVGADAQPWGVTWMVPEPDDGGTDSDGRHARHDSALFRGDARPDWELDGKELDSGEQLSSPEPAGPGGVGFDAGFVSSDDDDVALGGDENEVDDFGVPVTSANASPATPSGASGGAGNVDFLS